MDVLDLVLGAIRFVWYGFVGLLELLYVAELFSWLAKPITVPLRAVYYRRRCTNCGTKYRSAPSSCDDCGAETFGHLGLRD